MSWSMSALEAKIDAFQFSFSPLEVVPVPFFFLHPLKVWQEMCRFILPSPSRLLLMYNCQTCFIILFPCALRRTASQFPPGLTSQLTLEPCAEKWAIRYLCLPFLALLPRWSPAYAGIKVPNKLHIMSSEECTCMFNGTQREGERENR